MNPPPFPKVTEIILNEPPFSPGAHLHQNQSSFVPPFRFISSEIHQELQEASKQPPSPHHDALPKTSPMIAKNVTAGVRFNLHTISSSELQTRLETSLDHGLSEQEALLRLSRDGPNTFSQSDYFWLPRMLSFYFRGFMLLLWPCVILSIIAYEPLGGDTANLGLAVVLLLVILFSGSFSIFQTTLLQG